MSRLEKRKKSPRDLFKSEKNHSEKAELTTEHKQFDAKIYQKFTKFMNQSRLQKLKERLSYFYGRNFPIAYKESYNFRQRWEDTNKKEEVSFFDIMKQQNSTLQALFAIIMLLNLFVVWAVTVGRCFRPQLHYDTLLQVSSVLGLLGRVTSALCNINIKNHQQRQNLGLKRILKIVYLDLISVAYFILYMASFDLWPALFYVLEIVVVGYLYIEAQKIYKILGFISVSIFYEYKYKILDLMINLVITAHFFSLLLYASTWGDSEKTWIKSLGIEQEDYFTQYIYSFYFCSTTILTVGYGDISPKNIKEICAVTIIQFCGVVFFGYLINEIGYNLSSMRKSEETLQKDLRTLNIMEKSYKVEKGLISKTKGFLANHQNRMDQLTPQEENALLGKLNEGLRGEIMFERSLSVIKTSIFFICRWSKEMQMEMALKMEKQLLSPNERLMEPAGNERIYIITKGKIDIFLNRFGSVQSFDRRHLKSITVSSRNKVGENVYGYTAVISNKPCALDATASQFTSCFYISKKDFEQCVNNTAVDRQYYHEIKAKINASEFTQSFQAPSILNIREHYSPCRTILIRKQKSQHKKLHNHRSKYFRNDERRVKRQSFRSTTRIIEQINDIVLSFASISLDSENTYFVNDDQHEESSKRLRIKSFDRVEGGARTKSLECFDFNGRSKKTMQQIILFNSNFQKYMEYGNYFPENNFTKVLEQLSRENYMESQKSQLLHKQQSFKYLKKLTLHQKYV